MSRNSRKHSNLQPKYNEDVNDYEDYGYKISNSKRQHKHRDVKFKNNEYEYDD